MPFNPKEWYLQVCLSANQVKFLFVRIWVIILKMLQLWQKFFSVQVDQIFLRLHAKIIMEVARTGKVMSRRDHLY